MSRDISDGTTRSLQALAVFRGIYKRVADQLDVDPSYVSRVARGERHAPYITDALKKEIERAFGKAGLHDGNGRNHNGDGKNHDHSPRTVAAPLSSPNSNGNHNGHARNGRAISSHGNAASLRKNKKIRKKTSAPSR